MMKVKHLFSGMLAVLSRRLPRAALIFFRRFLARLNYYMYLCNAKITNQRIQFYEKTDY